MAINNITKDDVMQFDGMLDSYQEIALKSAIYPGQDDVMGLVYTGLKGSGEAGEFSEHTGKAMRDDGLFEKITLDDGRTAYVPKELTLTRRDYLIKECGDELWYLSAKANQLGMRLSDIARINLAKLAERTAAGTLQGSGDDR